jgi:hypothetical protein
MTMPMSVFLITLIGFSLSAQGQSAKLTKISINDSVKIQTKITGFYSWYADLGKRQKLDKEFNPVFIKEANGKTTLDFTKYRAGLRKFDFTEDFIKRKINGYKTCLDSLKTISYDVFIKLEVDELEKITCDFSNTYEWSGGMEPIDGAELVTLNKMDKHTMESMVRFYNLTPGGVKHYQGSATLTIIQYKAGWMINDLR